MFKKLKDQVPQTEINTSEPLDFQIEELMIHIPGLHGWKGNLTTVEVTMPVVGVEIVYSFTGTSKEMAQDLVSVS